MSDLERLLIESLREAGGSYEPSDQAEARRRFLQRARRRRWYGFAQVAAAAGIGVAAFLFFTNTGTDEKVEPQPEVAGAPEIVATVEIGGDPVSIDATTGTEVWVAGDDRVVAIDPRTNEPGEQVLDIPADEVAVGENSVWVARDGLTGYIDRIDPSSGEDTHVDNVRALDGEGSFITWDIAAMDDSLMAVDGVSGNVYRFGRSRPERMFREFTWSDVAVDNDEVWVLDESEGSVFRVDPVSQEDPSTLFSIEPGRNSDLAVGLGYVWVSSGDGTLRRLSPGGAEEDLPLGDSYMDLTVHEKSVWALVNVDDEHKQLFEINPGSMEVIGEPLEIEGDANDVVAAAGSVWVADGGGEVLRIEPSRDAEDAPPPAEDDESNVGPTPPPSDDPIVFVYSANGDIYAETVSGEVRLLTASGDIEQHPSFAPDGQSILFERIDTEASDDPDGGSTDPLIIQLDLASLEERFLANGSWPSLAPDGRLAYVSTTAEIDDKPAASIAISKGSGDALEVEMNMVGTPELPNISHLSWNEEGTALIYQASGEQAVVKLAPVDGIEMQSDDVDLSSEFVQGETFVSPSSSSDGWINVLQLCCSPADGDPYESMDAGRVRIEDGRVVYEGEVLVDIPSIEPTVDVESTTTGSLSLASEQEPDARWTTDASSPSFFVSDGRSLWLVSSDGETLIGGPGEPLEGHEGETDFRGLAVHPSLLDD